jgi:predicted nucleic acid-binding protein
MNEPVVVLDSGVLDRASTDRGFRDEVRDLVGGGWAPLVPTVVLAETITGRPQDAATNQTIKRLGTVDTTQAVARRAGALRFRAERSGTRRLPSAIDAIVAAHAASAGAGVVYTTDPDDLRRLLVEHPRIQVETPSALQ